MVRNDDDCSFKDDPFTEIDVPWHRQVIQFEDVGDRGKPLGKISH